MPTDKTCVDTRDYHTSFFPFSENGEWGRGTLSLNGGGPILGDWRMKNGENFFSTTGEEWRMEKTSCGGRFYYFSPEVVSFTWNPHYKKCRMDEKTDFKYERVNRAYPLTTCGRQW
jgi:hypothetical protein